MTDSTVENGPPSAAAGDEDPLAGTMYRTIRRLGEGGMGEVVEAEHLALGNRVAVKLLRREHAMRWELKDRMRIEAQACARIAHKNLVLVTDFGETEAARVFVVMELLKGCSLGDELRRRGALPIAEAVDLVRQALTGLAAVHAAGLVHRDIKPDNLFLCDQEEGSRLVKVLDFGIAKIVDAGRDPRTPLPLMQPTDEGVTVGTPRYASPEQSCGARDIDARSDLYSMGWVLYAMLTGRPPFADRDQHGDLWHAHQYEMPALPSALAPHAILPELDGIVMKAIAKRRDDRFGSAEEFRAALAPFARLAGPLVTNVPAVALPGRGARTLDSSAPSSRHDGPPTSAPTSATVNLGPSPAALLATAAKTIPLGAAPGHPAAAVTPSALATAGRTADAQPNASTRPVHPWERTVAARPQRRKLRGVLSSIALLVLGLGVILLLRVLDVW